MVTEGMNLGTFGERIRTLRIKKGLSQKELAERIDMRESTISRYENDKRLYQWDGLVKLADALNTSVDYLLGRTSVSAPIGRLVSDGKSSDGVPPFLETYSLLPPDDQNLLMERALTLYDIRNRDKAKPPRRLRTLKRGKNDR
jgi:transcriptional regulator with XRE-family HTH domain